MLLHEGLEEAAGLFRILCDILLQFGDRHSGRIGHCVGGRVSQRVKRTLRRNCQTS
jgi:hypothetical protein